MITVITGTPGAGKTALAVKLMKELEGTRPIFTMGIPDLQIEHQPVPPVAEWTRLEPSPEDPSIKLPKFTFPPGSLIVIDESQNVYRPRNSSGKVPDYVAAFETHRHTGVDFWLITQKTSLIDANVRALAGKHLHIESNFFGRKLFEWPKAVDAESKTERDIASKKNYKLPKQVFDLYKSSSLHIKQKHSIPTPLIVVVVCLLLASVAGWFVYGRLHAKIAPESTSTTASTAQRPAQPGAVPGGQGGTVTEKAPLGVRPLDFQPVVPNRPETAPIFDSLRQVKAMEWPDACIASKARCSCYSGQGTVIRTVDEATCRDIVANGRHNPYKDAPQFVQAPAPAGQPNASPSPTSGPRTASTGPYEGNPIVSNEQPKFHQPFGSMKSSTEGAS
ncbi:zonula occludens toxin family protein [Pseudogulbenkiania sp. NH8B]|uniref:zonular occludens toxin family protein n=1 Tax=Pseudogulbenkiania sp. (strain NH8B) TaxID=748280 RepID=UPI0002279D9B|nr:zonular occludens toxin domain-containing protein [Pseudogulbenkiania sp. NH8B]BAK77091.1 zonula occludens toxin family protein [Pseudogulbenkiania sp. NH8B]